MSREATPHRLGLTVREHFAAAALQGLLANPDNTGMASGIFAGVAVLYADELIQALENSPLLSALTDQNQPDQTAGGDDALPF